MGHGVDFLIFSRGRASPIALLLEVPANVCEWS